MVGTPLSAPTGTGMGSFNTSPRVNSAILSDNNQQNDNNFLLDSTAAAGNTHTCDDINETFSNVSNDDNNWGFADQTNFDDVWEDPLKDGPDPRAAADFPQSALEVVAKDGTAKPGREAFGAKSNTNRNTYLPHGPDRPHKRSRHTNEESRSADDWALKVWAVMVKDNCLLYNADPPVEKKQMLARLFNMSYADVDLEFWQHRQGRHIMGPPPLPAIQISSVDEDDGQAGQLRSRSNDPDSFTTAESSSQYARSEADQTMTSISSVDSRRLQCTSPNCVKVYPSPSTWKRHEAHEHWNQVKFMCLLCAIFQVNGIFGCKHCKEQLPSLLLCIEHILDCPKARQGIHFLYKREVDLKGHLDKKHSNDRGQIEFIDKVRSYKKWQFPYDSDWPRQCSLCSQCFTTWDERANHYIKHHFPLSKRKAKSQDHSQKQISFHSNSQNNPAG
ncbi:hypothetical protein BGZ60DRAFT_433587 [Tricladium varicosporioides]|nr:hypothetical protein BGZ60DRAFT_433587 [Hymenoscyphus varicosporioides]